MWAVRPSRSRTSASQWGGATYVSAAAAVTGEIYRSEVSSRLPPSRRGQSDGNRIHRGLRGAPDALLPAVEEGAPAPSFRRLRRAPWRPSRNHRAARADLTGGLDKLDRRRPVVGEGGGCVVT